ncbi:hypothetical protein QTH97_22850 [Variovorax sp. J22R24]|uniref:hypothetical protein n=1 Tax=Variovorax gracilis TaxID=3053502 RepID=UPI002575F845|nr:hypothetical protein [Variovorax sp. J22R24]MDM0107803.1 hypothetical protein [Variovorax sp. J22R24]
MTDTVTTTMLSGVLWGETEAGEHALHRAMHAHALGQQQQGRLAELAERCASAVRAAVLAGSSRGDTVQALLDALVAEPERPAAAVAISSRSTIVFGHGRPQP